MIKVMKFTECSCQPVQDSEWQSLELAIQHVDMLVSQSIDAFIDPNSIPEEYEEIC